MGDAGYDYIVVGAGSAGCVLANRLSEDGQAQVLLVEAGGSDWHPLISIPIGIGRLYSSNRFDWGYVTEPDTQLNNRTTAATRGKVLGGTSSINVLAYTRGHAGDFDRWADMGLDGWSYRDVLPYFKRSETWEKGETSYRGGSGPVGTEFAKTGDPIFQAWVSAALDVGHSWTEDYNAEHQEGFGRSQYTIRHGRRSSSSRAHLDGAGRRKNLTILKRSHVLGIDFQGHRATGISYVTEGRSVRTATADCEVILCAGAFNSPQLLMLSGIGPADHLAEFGIRTLADLPVGENLQDHFGSYMVYSRRQPGRFHSTMRLDSMVLSLLRSYLFGSGPASILPGGLHAFIKTQPGLAVPDIEFAFAGLAPWAHLWFPLLRPAYRDAFGIRPILLHPESRGRVFLRSSDPLDAPRIQYNALSATADLPKLRLGVKLARDLVSQSSMAPFRDAEITPGDDVRSDAEIDAWLRKTAGALYHPCGTCAMGAGPSSVLDEQLRVRGFERLRVVDASAMPDIVSGHLNASILMMGEKAADLILGREAASEPVQPPAAAAMQ